MAERITYSDVIDSSDRYDAIVALFLRGQGWTESCDHPGCLWLWVREIEGKTYRCDRDTALSLEAALQHQGYRPFP